MFKLFKYILNILGLGVPEEPNIPNQRKRRLVQEDYEHCSPKYKRLNESKMSFNNYDELSDFPSITPTPFYKLGPLRLDEQQLYRTSAVHSNNGIISPSIPSMAQKYDYRESSSNRTKKTLQLLRDKKSPVVDLTDDKSYKSNDPIAIKDDSDLEPVNTFKKVLYNEPFMDPNYLTKFEEMRIQKKNEIVLYPSEDELCFPELTAEQETKINEALKSCNSSQLFADKYNLRIIAHDLKTFNEKEWLNDEIVNFYVNMIQERSQNEKLPKVYSFSTFFYPKLVSCGYSSLRRWTKRVDIFSFDIIVVPIHLGSHWCLAIIDFRDRSIRYYDSLLGNNMQCLNALENYLREEYKDKKKCEYDTSDGRKILMKDIPRQMNGSDCGVFSCTFAEFITRNAKILFTQEHIPYIRRKMVIEIIEGRLLT